MPNSLAARISGMNGEQLRQSLDEQGYSKLPPLLNEAECKSLIESYEVQGLYRQTIQMARYRFGIGEYKYYDAPLPDIVQQLRDSLYPELALTANRWLEQLGRTGSSYPESHTDFLQLCRDSGQTRPTPLILKYEAGGYNCLHQDLYGDVYFPFQIVFALNRSGLDYTGGEFLLIEQRPRAQSRGHVISLQQGEGLIFPTQYRPVRGSRGFYRVTLRHGVGTIVSGTRYSLGVIFHDAK
ncbi:2OG-Fe(II) oxygenase [Paenibacillus sp. GYB004]|uniref:2OG-Fe(II) oxygenase n=1 Tax=Paenibacillus sp. GYB004 TaxID=2994393 RepID=UPI002F9670C2